MSRLSKYKQIDPAHLAKLNAKKIKTVDDLWGRLGQKLWERPGEGSAGLERFAKELDLEVDHLVTVLSQSSKPKPKSEEKWDRFLFWFRNYWREAAALLIAVVLFGLLIAIAVYPRDTVIVQANETLPVYHVIGQNDVKVEKRFGVSGSFADADKVRGRYLLKPAKPGAIISSEHLSPALPTDVTLSCRRVLSLPVRGGLIGQTLAPHDRVRLLFSPRSAGAQSAAPGERTVDDVVVLAVSRQGDTSSLVVAFKNDTDLNRAELLLGTSDVFIAQVLP